MTAPATHLSRSDTVPMPRSAEAVVFELHDLATAAKLEGPYVLVAHSLGGLFARLYAAIYPGIWSIPGTKACLRCSAQGNGMHTSRYPTPLRRDLRPIGTWSRSISRMPL